MPRMQPTEASSKLRKRELDQWLYLIRNPEFQRDLRELKRQFREGQPVAPPKSKGLTALAQAPDFVRGPLDKIKDLCRKWSVRRLPFDAVLHPDIPDLSRETVPQYENFIEDGIFPSPVLVFADAPPPHRIAKGKLNFVVDNSSTPVEVLLALIESHLRNSRKIHEGGPIRKHLSKGRIYRQVFDRFEAGESYSAISIDLGIPKSTVQSAYLKAKLLVGGSAPVPKWWQKVKKGPHRRRANDPASFNIDKHLAKCLICKNAEGWDQHCEPFKSWATANLGPTFMRFEDMRPDGSLRGSFSADEEPS